jgi:phosphopantothenoylcysteine decarboxylase/phosphopantothenate--cysteine ligase
MAEPHIILGVCGSVACYRACDLIQLLRGRYTVSVVMTACAGRFIRPRLFETLTGRPVLRDLFDARFGDSYPHIALARQADVLVIAPATAATIGRLASGVAGDALSTIALCIDPRRRPCLIAPAMSAPMTRHPVVERNLRRLRRGGYRIIESRHGRQACGETGSGRLAAVADIARAVGAAVEPLQVETDGSE